MQSQFVRTFSKEIIRIFRLNMTKSRNTASRSKSKSDIKSTEKINDAIYSNEENEIFIHVHATPNARCNLIKSVEADCINVQVAAPAVDGDANAELLRFVAEELDLKKKFVSLAKGSRSRDKVIQISSPDVTAEEILSKLHISSKIENKR